MQIYILFGMLLQLLKHEKMRAKDLAEEFEVSTRTVYRYVDCLNISGVPIVTFTGKNGGIGICDTFSLDKLYFTKAEIENLLSLLQKDKKPDFNSGIIKLKLETILMHKNT